jgi:hypothetical protein
MDTPEDESFFIETRKRIKHARTLDMIDRQFIITPNATENSMHSLLWIIRLARRLSVVIGIVTRAC